MTKTPYEIRYDLLNYAMSQLTGEYFAAMERIRDTTEPNSPNRISAMNKLKYPTKSDIILLAEDLKTFIEKKKYNWPPSSTGRARDFYSLG